MAIEISISNNFLSSFVNSTHDFGCHLSSVFTTLTNTLAM